MNERVKTLLTAIMLIGALLPLTAHAGLLCKGSSDQIAPDTTSTAESTVIRYIVETAGDACGPIKGKFTDLYLHYKLAGPYKYTTVSAKPIPLPENYRRAASTSLQFEAYEFTIPPYPDGTTGQIEYYIDSKFNGYANTANGSKKITIVFLKSG